MDLRNGAISLGEIVRDPKARALVDREFPGILNHPFARRFLGMSLSKALGMARGRVPEDSIQRLLAELREL
ncbi:MAG: hypothetical protein HFF14_07675 [Angelakisella sp.]|jgi:hypothetical protein|nr:hypothetical protein [Angelakisella sp.]